jgi:hypothetical protein
MRRDLVVSLISRRTMSHVSYVLLPLESDDDAFV